MNLHYSLLTASFDYQENRHAQTVMKELGITYKRSIPQSLSDSWWFIDCENIPAELPKYLSELKLRPGIAERYGIDDAAPKP